MKTIRVLFYSNDNILNIGIQSLITSKDVPNLTVVRASTENELIEQANGDNPDVIIVEAGFLAANSGLLNLLLKGLQDNRLIIPSEEHNILHVYTRQDISIHKASDLMAIIRLKK